MIRGTPDPLTTSAGAGDPFADFPRKPLSPEPIHTLYPPRGEPFLMLGISTFCLHELPLAQALEILREFTDTVEIMDDGNHYLETAEPLGSHDLRYFLHSPSRGVNIASLREPIRRASVEVLSQCFAVGADVGAPVVVHPGYFAWKGEREAAVGQFRRSLGDLKKAATDLGVTFYVENMPAWDFFFLRFPDEIPLLDGQGFALDVGHAHLNGCLPGFLEQSMAHVHLHDNDGKTDSHDPVGKGSIDFRPVKRAVERDHASAIVEVATLAGVLESMKILEAL
jgi:sugar phosphate isomerase/epimerase